MQLREQGKLDLDTDVNEYLDGPRTCYAAPLDTGIEDRIVQLFGDDCNLMRERY